MESEHTLNRPVPSKRCLGNTTSRSFTAFDKSSISQTPQLFGSRGSNSSYCFGAAPTQTKNHSLQRLSGFGNSSNNQSPQLFGSSGSRSTPTACSFGAAPTQTSRSNSSQRLPGFGFTSISQPSQMFGQCGSGSTLSNTACSFGAASIQTSKSNSSEPTSFTFSCTMPVEHGNNVNNNTFGVITEDSNLTNKLEADKLYQIISFQSFDGSFIWDSNLIQILELIFDAVKQGMIKFLKFQRKILGGFLFQRPRQMLGTWLPGLLYWS